MSQALIASEAARPPYGAALGGAGMPAVGPPPAPRAIPTPLEMLYALKRRWVLAASLGFLVGLVGAAGVWMAMPTGKHQVRALVQVRPASAVLGKGTTDQDFDSFKQNQLILLKTRFLLNRVLSRPKVAALPFVRQSPDPARMLEDTLRLQWQSPEILALTMNGDEPQQLKVILDTLMAEYVDDAKSDEAKTRDARFKSLDVTKTDVSKRIAAIEGNLKRLQASSGGEFGPSPQSAAIMIGLYTQELSRLHNEVTKLSASVRARTTALEEMKARLGEVDAAPIDPAEMERAAVADPSVRLRAEAVIRARDDLAKNEIRLAAGSPLLARLTTEVKKAERELEAAEREFRPQLEAAVRAARRKELLADIQKTTEQLKADQKELANDELNKRALTDKVFAANRGALIGESEMEDLKALRERRDTLSRELLQLDFERRAESRVQVREEGVVSLNQNLMKKLTFSLAGGAAGFLGMVVSVGFVEWRTRRVDSVDQVISELGMRVIGTIPAFPTRSATGEAARDEQWRFVLNEAVNSTRTMLLHAAHAHSMQVLMVTSAGSGEGKTSLASQLATSMAGAGLRTVILDADLRKPSMHTLFDTPLAPGCAEVMMQEADVSDAAQPTGVPNLWLIPAGQCSFRVVAALAQGHPFEALLNRLRGQFDVIVVDTSPVLPVADALLIGQHVDGVVLSLLQDVSQIPKVRTAAERLVMLSIPLLGAVVSGVRSEFQFQGYNYVRQLPA